MSPRQAPSFLLSAALAILASPTIFASSGDPICIYTASELLQLTPTGDYRLCADIDLLGTTFSPLPSFSGTFEGDGHRISNLVIQAPGSNAVGLFSEIGPGALVQNMVIFASSVDGQDEVGCLAGVNRGVVANCHVRSSSVTGRRVVGLLLGNNEGRVFRCSTEGTVGGPGETPILTGNMGGIAGRNTPQATIRGSQSSAVVYGTSQVGGLVGVNLGWILGCAASGAAMGNALNLGPGRVYGASAVGGLVGYNVIPGVIGWSHASAQVRGTFDVGGLVGKNQEGVVGYCSSASYVEGVPTVWSDAFGAGGLVGTSLYGYIGRCEAAGAVRGNHDVGGFIGLHNFGMIEECFSQGNVTGLDSGANPPTRIGGFAGMNYGSSFGSTTIRNCYSAGAFVRGGVNVGGLVGLNHAFVENSYSANAIASPNAPGPVEPLVGANLGSVRETYYDREVDGLPESLYAGLPATTSEMQSPASGTFVSWDLTHTWRWDGGSYPQLRWRSP